MRAVREGAPELRTPTRQGLRDYGLNAEYTACTHDATVMVRIDCGSGGMQYRRACLTCWHLSPAIPHAVARAEEERTGIAAPLADLHVLHAARDAYLSRTGTLI
jgi:hypothetical protein